MIDKHRNTLPRGLLADPFGHFQYPTSPYVEDEAQVIRRVQQHLIAREQRIQQPAPSPVAVGYDAGDLSVLFGGDPQ